MLAPRCPMEKSVREKEVLVLAHSSVCVELLVMMMMMMIIKHEMDEQQQRMRISVFHGRYDNIIIGKAGGRN